MAAGFVMVAMPWHSTVKRRHLSTFSGSIGLLEEKCWLIWRPPHRPDRCNQHVRTIHPAGPASSRSDHQLPTQLPGLHVLHRAGQRYQLGPATVIINVWQQQPPQQECRQLGPPGPETGPGVGARPHPRLWRQLSENAGAASIGYHMTIPEHHGLFQRAILQSGAVNTMPAGRAQVEGQRYFNHLCKHFRLLDAGLSGTQRLDALRKIPVKELVKAGDRGRVGMFTPTIDDILIHGDSREWVHNPARYDPGL